MRLDEFFYIHLKNKHEKSWQCIQKLLVLSHGQATVERGFSTNKKIEVENLKENSYIALRIISDHINRFGGDITKVIIDKDLRKSVMSARHLYDQYLEDQRKMEENKQKRKIDDDNEIEFQTKKKHLQCCLNELTKSADEFADQAEKKDDMTLLSKSNSLRKTAKKKIIVLQKLEKRHNEKNFK